MRSLRILVVLSALLSVLSLGSGCADDCRTYCSDQADQIDECLPQFELTWDALGPGYTGKSDFVGQCRDAIDAEVARDTEETCGTDTSAETYGDCATTVEQGMQDACENNLNQFRGSCSSAWTNALDFTPETFVPEPIDEGDDDDDSAADDDDDDSAGDDDDSAR